MSALSWFPEPFQAYGSFAGDGARRVLGKPELDALTVLVRETAQNSWDARRPDKRSIGLTFDGWRFTDDQLHLLRQEVFTEVPPAGIALGDVLDMEEVDALVVSDRGTVGLTGPTRADRPPTGRTDFIDLVFNMGQPRDIEGGGGTYGFGKTIAYIVSEASTVLLYTRSRIGAELESRLIGVAVGNQYATNERRYTGRHWWGVADSETISPLVGTDAEVLAARLGFPSFDDADTGLSMMIISPAFGDRTPRQAMEFMAEAVAWHFWPKLVPADGEAEIPIRMRVSWEGEKIAVPDPETRAPLDGFVRALRAIHAAERGEEWDAAVDVKSIGAQRPNRQLGQLALTRMSYRPRSGADENADADEDESAAGPAPFTDRAHHVALMRRVELVVKYLEGPLIPGAQLEWAGVFLNDIDIDAAFAEAEPPTHDSWNPKMVEDRSNARLVRLALRGIGKAVSEAFSPAPTQLSLEQVRSGVVVANELGQLVASSPGTGTRKRPRSGNGSPLGGDGGGGSETGERGDGLGGVSTPGTVRIVGARSALRDGQAATEVEVEVVARGRTTVRGAIKAAIDGTAPERDPPLGAAVPRVIGWRLTDADRIIVEGETLVVDSDALERWVMVAVNPAETAVSVDVTIAPDVEP